ncbi:MAG: nicotinamide riboside transporter PnuC [Saprospiraceae bacterium]
MSKTAWKCSICKLKKVGRSGTVKMGNLIDFFLKDNIVLTIGDYRMSWIELLATVFNLGAVWLSAKEKVSNWGIGLVGIVFFFGLSYQVNLYADMFLQVFYFVFNCVGWYKWTHPDQNHSNHHNQLKISSLSTFQNVMLFASLMTSTFFLGIFFVRIHLYFPLYFPSPAAFPFSDSFVMAGSIFAQILIIYKKIEAWLLWIVVNCAAIFVYAQKEIFLTSLLYMMFLVISFQGLYNWRKKKY